MDRAQLEQRILSRRRAGSAAASPGITRADRSNPLPLSCGQERFWLVNRFALGGPMAESGNCAFWFRLAGRLDVPALRSAISHLQERHEILRTVIRPQGGQNQQVVLPAQPVALPVEQLPLPAQATPAERTTAALQQARRLAAEPFDLAVDPPTRWNLLRLSETEQVLLLRIHHIACDGWSESILFGELAQLYSSYASGQEPRLPKPALQYVDFASWQRRQLAGGDLAGQLEYFREALDGAPASTTLPGDPAPGANQLAPGAVLQRTLSPAAGRAAQQLSGSHGATLFMVLLAAYSALLHRHSGQTDLVVGAPVAGRSRPELANLIGFFVNTVPIRIDLSGDPEFAELLLRVRESSLGALANQDLPFEVLVERLGVPRVPGRPPLVQTMLQVHNTPAAEFDFAGLQVELRQIFTTSAALDLTASFLPCDAGLAALWEYRADLFDEGQVEQLQRELDQLLIHAGAEPATRLSDLRLLDEVQTLEIERWSTGATRATAAPDVVTLFEEAVDRIPDTDAVRDPVETLSYAELDRRANRLARHLLGLPVRADELVGICLPRGSDAVVAILAVLKAGAGYLPIDPDYPASRRQFMIDDAGLSAIVATGELLTDLALAELPVVLLDQDADLIAAQSDDRVGLPVEADGQAYVIYTSGSTGRPKGAAVDHRGLANYLNWAAGHYRGVNRPDAVLHSSLSFDLTVTSIFVPLISGGCIQVIGDRQPLPALDALLSEPDITIGLLKLTPAHLRALLPVNRSTGRLAAVDNFVIGGEALPRDLVARWQQLLPQSGFFNEYGPTETVVGCAVHRFDPASAAQSDSVPIGRPIDNTQLHVLDRFGNRVAVGRVGELYIGGDGVCRGYPGRPGLTADRFVPDHLGASPGGRLYRTGDLARWDEFGVLHFLGRGDNQVKVRGYRIELGEIDNAIRSCDGVAEAITDFRTEPERLIGYYTCEPGQQVDPAGLQVALAARLPAGMLPDQLLRLDRLPLTVNGKVDRSALPEPERQRPATTYQAPSNPVETAICRIWSEALGVERVGLDDNFFALGGHSMQAAAVVARVAENWPLLPSAGLLRTLFAEPTARQLSAQVLDLMCRVCSAPPEQHAAESDAGELSDVKRGLFFLQQLRPSSVEFLVPIAIELRGRCDRDALLSALRQLPGRHPALRGRFELTDAGPRQLLEPASPLPVRQDDLLGLDEQTAADRMARILADELSTPIDLVAGPLIRTRICWIEPDRQLLLLITHHIVTDGRANLALLADLGQLYGAGGSSSVLPPPEVARTPSAPVDPAVREQDLRYWLEHLSGLPELLLPTDRPRPPSRTGHGSVVDFTLDHAVAAGVERLARQHASTEFAVLLAATAALLSGLAGQDDFAIGTSSALGEAAQPNGAVDISIDQVALRMDVSGDPSFAELIGRVRDRCQSSFAHPGASFFDIVQATAPERDLSRTPLFQVAVELALPELPPDLFPGLQAAEVPVPTSVAKYDLSFLFQRATAGIRALVEYSVDLFEHDTVEAMATALSSLLEIAVREPDRSVRELLDPLLPSRPSVEVADPGSTQRTGSADSPELDSAEPEPELAGLLRQTWAELLGRENVGLDEDFFQLGGDSLLALRLTSKLRRVLQSSELPLELIFRFPTVRTLAPELERLLLAEIDQLSEDEVVDALGAT